MYHKAWIHFFKIIPHHNLQSSSHHQALFPSINSFLKSFNILCIQCLFIYLFIHPKCRLENKTAWRLPDFILTQVKNLSPWLHNCMYCRPHFTPPARHLEFAVFYFLQKHFIIKFQDLFFHESKLSELTEFFDCNKNIPAGLITLCTWMMHPFS